jgi:4-carboxymuconolactone decarboxylase
MSADEEAVYNFIAEIFKTKHASDAAFAAVKNIVGERGVVDLMVSAGYYQVVSMLMNVDRLAVNANQQPELKYLAAPLP